MMLVDTALKAAKHEASPIRVGIVGAGFMSQGLTNQIVNSMPGMRMVAVSNRKLERALDVFRYAGFEECAAVETRSRSSTPPSRAGRAGGDRGCAASRALRACRRARRVTGSVEFGAHVVLEAFKHGKDVVLMNAEIDATIGPILQVYAAQVRRDPVGLRRRRARRADESVPLGQGAWADPRASSATSRACRIPIAIRRPRRASPSDGARTRRW